MNNDKCIMTIRAVINTLNSTYLRVDQVDAINRINACVHELATLAQQMDESKAETEAKG